jgi:hypothetical protein
MPKISALFAGLVLRDVEDIYPLRRDYDPSSWGFVMKYHPSKTFALFAGLATC